MKNPTEIRKLAKQRLSEAEILCKSCKYEGAFYLAGYGIELMLKAKICERLGIPNLFDETEPTKDSFRGMGEIRKALKTHSLFILLAYSGLKSKFEENKTTNFDLFRLNPLFFTSWDQTCRYRPCGYMSKKDVETLVYLLSQPNVILSWIEQQN